MQSILLYSLLWRTERCCKASCLLPGEYDYLTPLCGYTDCSGVHGLAQKMYNWCTLNQKVFKRLGFVVAKSECQACASCQPGAIERVLKLIRLRLSRFAEGPGLLLTGSAVCPILPLLACCSHCAHTVSSSVPESTCMTSRQGN